MILDTVSPKARLLQARLNYLTPAYGALRAEFTTLSAMKEVNLRKYTHGCKAL